jgi:hypothetical protein
LAARAAAFAFDAGVVAALATERHHELTMSTLELPGRQLRHRRDM